MKCVQLLSWTVVFLLSHQLALVDAKVRNRVQKWQQRTWRARFGAGPRRDWRTAFDPPKTHRRSRYGLSPREDDFFAPDAVPNAYSNYHYRRLGGAKSTKSARSTKPTSDRRRERGEGKHTLGNRLKRHARGYTAGLGEELKDYLDPIDMMLLDYAPSSEFVPLHPEFAQQFNIDEDLGEMPISSQAGTTFSVQRDTITDKQPKEFKIVFHHRNPSGGCIRSRYQSNALRRRMWHRRSWSVAGLGWIGAVLFVVLVFWRTVNAAPTSDCGTPPANGTVAVATEQLIDKPNVPELDPLRWLVSKSGSFFKG
uniref:Transmembrane protein n=1 Tax=Anopheles farauti TaxID=69004 RepID=A0A182Q130_9DIPT